MAWIECRPLARHDWLIHAFSTRRGGLSHGSAAGLNLGFVESDTRANVEKNRERFLRTLGARTLSLASLRQVHSDRVYQVVRGAEGQLEYRPSGYNSLPAPYPLPQGDALITDEPGVLLTVRSADCLPILLADPHKRAIAAIHAGWRGALRRVAEKTVGAMRAVFGSDPQDLVAAIGPGIHACCYEVGEETVAAFSARFTNSELFFRTPPPSNPSAALANRYPLLFLSRQPPGRISTPVTAAYLDLVAVAESQLRDAGLRPARLYTADLCTACRTDLFFSHRKEGPRTGRMMAVIGIRPERPGVSSGLGG